MPEEERQARLAVEPAPLPAETVDRPASAPERLEEKPAADGAVLAALADQEKEILSLLFQSALTADELIGRTELPARRVNSALTVLQVRGLIQEIPGRRFEAAVRFAEV